MTAAPAMVDVFIAAGSNVDAVANLRKALAALRAVYPTLRVSPAYRNKAVGFAGDDFINLVVSVRSQESLEQLRERLQQIEALCGRPRDAAKWAPRSMDLDILLYGEAVRTEPGLMVPRPDLVRRPYMLKPMAELAPHVVHPTLGKTMQELWSAFDAAGHEMTEVSLEQ